MKLFSFLRETHCYVHRNSMSLLCEGTFKYWETLLLET